MERQILWEAWNEPGLEHLRLYQGDVIGAHGMIIGVAAEQPFLLHYDVRCNSNYRFLMARITLFSPVHRARLLTLDADGLWRTDESSSPLTELHGCIDIDISATPFTNTLPIRRLGLKPGETAEIQVVYITVPALQISPALQRYTCLAHQPDDHTLYRFESPADKFTADIRVDLDGLVVEYPELFRRVWPDWDN